MLTKLMIIPWFGELPPWFEHWQENFSRLKKYGYDLLMPRSVDEFKQRAKDKLGIENCPVKEGTGKVHDYRLSFGKLYEDELKGYDFYGHTDLDCVYGRVDKYATEALLQSVDIHSNHHNYICGPWTLYRNVDKVNNLFYEYPRWKEELEAERISGWGEVEYSQIVDKHAASGDIRLKYTNWQGKNPHADENLRWRDESLFDGEDEIMMFHFRHLKRWPHALSRR